MRHVFDEKIVSHQSTGIPPALLYKAPPAGNITWNDYRLWRYLVCGVWNHGLLRF